MAMTRVVVTGVGAVSCQGIGADTLWQAARDGVSGRQETLFPRNPDQKVKIAAPVSPDLLAQAAVHHKPRMQDPVSQMALIATQEAVEQAGLAPGDFGDRDGVSVGSGFGGAATLDDNYLNYAAQVGPRMDPMCVPKIMTNAAASWISMTWGVTGPVYCNSTACSSASQSIGLAYHMVKSGMIDRCITGGTEGCVVSGVFRSWEVLRVLSPNGCRPFSKDRNGMMLGEGAGILVIETLASAQARGAQVLAEIVGYGTSSDAGDLLRPDPVGAAKAMSAALTDTGIDPGAVGYVNAHGTATVANDAMEAEAMRRVFGPDHLPPVSSTKPIHGHALGAAGALESVVTLAALRAQLAPPNIEFTEPDPKVGLTPITGAALPLQTRYAMNNSFAFGGINASLIFSCAPD